MSRYAIPMKRAGWAVVPPGNYILALADVQEGPTFANRAGQPEPMIRLVLRVERGPHMGMEVSALINPAATGAKSNTRRWAEALTGSELEDGALFDPEAWLGTSVWAKVEVVPDGNGIERNRIPIVMSLGALDAQTSGSEAGSGSGTAAPRPVGDLTPSGGLPPRPSGRPPARAASKGPADDRQLELDDAGWDALVPPPAEDGEEAGR